MNNKIIITGGHLTPALAVIEELQKDDWKVLFVGRKHAIEGDKTVSVEYKTIQELGISFFSLTTGRLQRSFTRHTIPSLLKIPIGFFQSFYILLKFKPQIILSFGGYLAVPVALVGWCLGIPVITHEQTITPGLANKIVSHFAKKTCVSWDKTTEKTHGDKVILTGNPVRKEIFSSQFPISQFSNKKLPLIYITGGSLGAHVINETVMRVLPKLLEKFYVIHQCGDNEIFNDYEKLNVEYSKLNTELKDRYILTKYIDSKNIGWVLNNADLVISRAGANTVTELAALGKPTIFIPLPWAGQNEQMENAKMLENVGIAMILSQKDLTNESLIRCITTMIENLDLYKGNSEKSKKLIQIKAAEKIVEVIDEVLLKKAT